MKKLYVLFSLLFSAAIAQAQPAVACDSILQTSTCAGGNVIVPFTVTGGNFNFGNTFTAQLSDNWGSFANPVNIGSVPWFTSGVIFATIPSNANFGFLYRIRVIASNPSDTSNTSPNTLIVTQVAQLNTILANPGDTACTGDTVTLFAVNPASAYSWSTGDTTQSITVTQGGVYTVTTTDFLTCQSTTSDTIAFVACTGFAEHTNATALDVFPNPADDQLTLKWTSAQAADAQLSFYNALGQLELRSAMHLQANSETSVNVSALPQGIYFLVLESDGVRITRRIAVR